MPSIHTHKAIEKAERMGAWAGDMDATVHLWNLSKRELVEVALRLGAKAEGKMDTPSAGVKAVNRELTALRRWNIV